MRSIRTAIVVGLGVGLCALTALVPAASADDGSSPLVNADYVVQVGGGPTYWEATWDASSCETGDPAYTPVSDGAFGPDYAQSDAFDDGLIVTVNGKNLTDKDSILNVTNDQVIADGIHAGGVHVWRYDRTFDNSPTLRSLIAFHNGHRDAKRLTVLWDSNLGSDGGEAVRDSSNGNTSYEVAKDKWVVSSDDATTPGDPALTFALFGARADERPTDVLNDFGSGCFTPEFKIKVPPRATVYLLFFTQMHDTNEHAINAAPKLESPSKGLLVGLSRAVRANILNWSLG